MPIKSIYEEVELAEGATIKDFLIVQNGGNTDQRFAKWLKI